MASKPSFLPDEVDLIYKMVDKGRIDRATPRGMSFTNVAEIQTIRERLDLSERRFAEIEEEAIRRFWRSPKGAIFSPIYF